jgi:hypothetical protein
MGKDSDSDDDLRDEYDFTVEDFRSAVRGKYAAEVVILAPDPPAAESPGQSRS